MDKLGDMNLFVHIVKNGGLAAAGRELGLSPASMSARLNALEARYNTRLLNRSTRHVSLTETGKEFYDACLNILADVNEVETNLLGAQGVLSGTLRITAPSDLGQQHIMPVLSTFIEKHPEITPHLHLSDDLISITEKSFDCAIRYGELADSNLVARKLAESYRVLVASPDYLKKKGTPKRLQELEKHDCLIMTRGIEPLTHWHFHSKDKAEIITIKAKRSCNDGALIRRWALEGAGIALKSYIDVADDLKADRLVSLLENTKPDFAKTTGNNRADLHIICPSRKYMPERLKTFIKFLRDHFSQYQ